MTTPIQPPARASTAKRASPSKPVIPVNAARSAKAEPGPTSPPPPRIAKVLPPGAALSPAPWTLTDDGTILDGAGRVVCVMGAPFEALTDQDRVNAAPILVLPELLDLLAEAMGVLKLLRDVRPDSWTDPEDPVVTGVWTALDHLLAGFYRGEATPHG